MFIYGKTQRNLPDAVGRQEVTQVNFCPAIVQN